MGARRGRAQRAPELFVKRVWQIVKRFLNDADGMLGQLFAD